MMTHQTVDKVSALLSFGCSIHCAILPCVISILPLLGLAWLADERIEICFLTLSAMLGITSLCYGFHVHGKMRALALLATGIGLMAVGHMSEDTPAGICIAVSGGLTIAASHFINHKLCTSCHTCGGH